MRIRGTRMAAWLVIGGAALSLQACGTNGYDLCDLECECEGCSEGSYQACLNDVDRDANEADFRDCGGFYDDYLYCQEQTGFCDGRDWDTSCKPERDRYRDCVD